MRGIPTGTQTANGWSAPTRLQSFTLGFGYALALQEDTLVAAAPHSNTVFVYQRRNRAWSLNAEIPAPTGGSAGLFGWSVALHRGRIAIGAPAGSFEGSVYLYSQVNGAWSPALAVNATAVGVAPEAQFGTSVALFDTTLAAGASNSFVGTATTVTLNANAFTPAGQWSADSGGPEALFGRHVLVPDNKTLIVASPGWSSATAAHLGAVDIFQQ